MRKVDLVVAEIGSTTTVVSAFNGLAENTLSLVAQGQAATTVLDGDVTIGLYKALGQIEDQLGDTLDWDEMVASSSAAGGLRMTVHGLVYDMTVKAAREAALGAGANIHWVTAGELSPDDIARVEQIRPNIILLAGGVDYGEKNTVIANARHLSALKQPVPVIYAGNIAAAETVRGILESAGFPVSRVDNVYPRIDKLNIEPSRRIIHEVFEKHIVEAPGMQKIRELVSGRIIPTPGAVMRAAQLLYEMIGDLMVLDVGGATTDVHSVTEGDPETAALLVAPEPLAKRTVEGDLGVYINAGNVLSLCDLQAVCKKTGRRPEQLMELCVPIPATAEEREFISCLAAAAVKTAVERHAGTIEYLYGPTGRMTIARGKDLTQVKWIIGTGGALTRLPAGPELLAAVNADRGGLQLLPRHGKVLVDHQYIFAAAGLLADKYPIAAQNLLRASLKLEEGFQDSSTQSPL
ncbi:MAG TPA: GlmL-related ornithine degradation protein [Selenomonadales bacterium]|nr:GlmL-related ornithine degradation protein [Selenomonadales bacterium]